MVKTSSGSDPIVSLQKALVGLREQRSVIDRMKHGPIAVIGLACRFPGGETAKAFWQMLRKGASGIRVRMGSMASLRNDLRGSGTSRSGSKSNTSPMPSQVRHMPVGELKLNS